MNRSLLVRLHPAASVALGAALLLAALPAAAQTRYVAFGDSITEGVGDTDFASEEDPGAGYPARLQALLPNGDVVEKQGKSGENTIEGLSRLPGVLLEGGDTLLLMMGTNDVSNGIAVEDTIFNLRQMARQARNQGLDVVVATVIPRLPGARAGGFIDADGFITAELNQEIRNLAGLDNHRLVDPYESFQSQDRLFATLYWRADDPVGHPNPAGYDVMAQTFADVLTGTDTAPPVNGSTEPTIGTYRVLNNQPIRVDLWDLGTGIALDSARLFINGQESAARAQGNNRFATITHTQDRLQGPIEVRLTVQDRANPANSFDRVISRFYTRGTNFPDGDFDRDGRVDGEDLVVFGRSFGRRPGEEGYTADADLDGSGAIDGDDLAIFASNFGNTAN